VQNQLLLRVPEVGVEEAQEDVQREEGLKELVKF